MHRLPFLLAAAMLGTLPAHAELRVQRLLDWRSGLPSSYTTQIAQDPAGFLWFTTTGGIVRFDGNEARTIAPPPLSVVSGSVAHGRPLFLRPRAEGLWTIEDASGRPIEGPGSGASAILAACVTGDGALWASTREGLWRREAQTWRGPLLLPGGRRAENRLFAWHSDRVVVGTEDDAFLVSPSGAATLLAPARGLVTAARKRDGTAVLGCWRRDGGHVLEVGKNGWREIEASGSRLIAVAVRDDVVWIAYDGKLVRIPPGGRQETMATEQDLPGGGAMLVDREGSLWVATVRGVLQYPEPETTSVHDRFTLAARDLARTPGAVWMSSWAGMLVHRASGGGSWEISKASHINPACVAADGAVWTTGSGCFFRHPPGGEATRISLASDAPSYAWPCGEGVGERLWFPTDAGLFVLGPEDAAPRRVPGPPLDPDVVLEVVAEDLEGNVWAGHDETICHAPIDSLQWSCETVPGMLRLRALRAMPSGDIWAATDSSGVWRRREGRFEAIPASRMLASPTTRALVPSPVGGVWIVGEANCLRVAERPDLAEGWEPLERVGVWQGLPTSGLMDLAEDPDGTLWLGTDMSLVRVPPEARASRPQPPPVAVVEATVDGKPIPTDREAELPYGKNRLELRFAALSYREPALIRYRTRPRPEDPWSGPSSQSSFRFVDLPPGRYRVEVAGSLDGRRWSPTEVAVAARVLPPWYASLWFMGAMLTAAVGVLIVGYRLRVAHLLRLERQRTQIAMDLHDAIGSGLGSIRILSGLAVRETTPEATRATVSVRIAEIADELATSLGDIVWSLRPGAGTLESLGSQLVARATPLVTAQGMTLETALPLAQPEVPLSLAVRRHVFLVGLEAIHNAARHAAGTRVSLTLERTGRRLRLRIEDDGRGLSAPRKDGAGRSGLGLESIRRRAAEIGAQARWEERPGGGTLFTLDFDARSDASHPHATGALDGSSASSEPP